MFKKIYNRIILALHRRNLLNWIPDKPFLKLIFKVRMGIKLNINNPATFNEKLQWLKLYNRKPEMTTMVDKYAVKEYITEKIGEEYVIPTLGVWDRFDEIDFSSLPDQFVLKCTHDSGGIVICRDKSKLDKFAAKKKIERSLKNNYYTKTKEWPYKNVKPRIIAEKFIEDETGGLVDYKFFCFDGVVDSVMICLDRHIGDPKFYFFDEDWNLKRLNIRGKEAPADFTVRKPDCIDEMFAIAKRLSVGHPFVRVDLYECSGKIYFGELTFYPDSGFDSNLLSETDVYFGKLLNLGTKQMEEK